MTDKIDIPDEAVRVKPIFEKEPGREIADEVRAWVKRTGEPHLWRGHTHTKPPGVGTQPLYIGRYSLPVLQGIQRWAPCPCCSPNNLKYFREGRIAWFPEERVIRNIGDKCYRTLNPEGHELAERGLLTREREERRRTYMLANFDKVRPMIEVAEKIVPIGQAVEAARRILAARFDQLLPNAFWEYVRDGRVSIITRHKAPVQIRGEDEKERWFELPEPYGSPLSGYLLFKRPGRSIVSGLKKSIIALGAIDFGEGFREHIEAMTTEHRAQAERLFAKSRSEIERCRTVIADEVGFFSAMNIATLKGWSLHRQCPAPIYIDFSDGKMIVGRDQNSASPLELPPDMWKRIPELPALAG